MYTHNDTQISVTTNCVFPLVPANNPKNFVFIQENVTLQLCLFKCGNMVCFGLSITVCFQNSYLGRLSPSQIITLNEHSDIQDIKKSVYEFICKIYLSINFRNNLPTFISLGKQIWKRSTIKDKQTGCWVVLLVFLILLS